jgi:hypothetical protein
MKKAAAFLPTQHARQEATADNGEKARTGHGGARLLKGEEATHLPNEAQAMSARRVRLVPSPCHEVPNHVEGDDRIVSGDVALEKPIEGSERLRFGVVAVAGRSFALEKALQVRRQG